MSLSAESASYLALFFSYNKLMNNTFSHSILAKRIAKVPGNLVLNWEVSFLGSRGHCSRTLVEPGEMELFHPSLQGVCVWFINIGVELSQPRIFF